MSSNQPKSSWDAVLERVPKMAPPRTNPVLAYRWWIILRQYGDGGGVVIASQYNQEVWPPRRRMEAVCRVGERRGLSAITGRRPLPVLEDAMHGSPAWDCTCGIYAIPGPLTFGERDEDYVATLVAGKVALWGRVVETERGYRGQYAYPTELMIVGKPNDANQRMARVLGRRYGVAVLTEADWWDMQDLDWPFA